MIAVDLLLTSPPAFSGAEVAPDGYEVTIGRLERAVPGDGPLWILIDWALEGSDGLERCKAVRTDPRLGRAHVIMLLSEDSVEQVRQSLAAGANDVMLAPLDPARLRTQMKMILPTQTRAKAGGRLQRGPLVVDCDAIQARWDDFKLHLPLNEFRLLHFLAENANRVLTRSELIAGLGKKDPPIDDRTVDVWIARLRRELKKAGADEVIRTVRPLGYVLDIY